MKEGELYIKIDYVKLAQYLAVVKQYIGKIEAMLEKSGKNNKTDIIEGLLKENENEATIP